MKCILLFIFPLQANVEVEEFDISWNGLAEEGSRVFGTHLAKNHTLQTLDISENRITFRHLGHFLKGLKENDTLQTLKVSNDTYLQELSRHHAKFTCEVHIHDIADFTWN